MKAQLSTVTSEQPPSISTRHICKGETLSLCFLDHARGCSMNPFFSMPEGPIELKCELPRGRFLDVTFLRKRWHGDWDETPALLVAHDVQAPKIAVRILMLRPSYYVQNWRGEHEMLPHIQAPGDALYIGSSCPEGQGCGPVAFFVRTNSPDDEEVEP